MEHTHPSTAHMLGQLQVNPNLPDLQRNIAQAHLSLAEGLLKEIQDGPELTAGLRKLLEAKDCFVRASLDLDPVYYTDR